MKGDDAFVAGCRLYGQRRYREALLAFMDCDINPAESLELSYFMGLCYSRTGELNLAVDFLSRVAVHDQRFVRVFQSRMILAYIYCRLKRFLLAEGQLSKLLKQGYASPQIYGMMGFVCFQQGKTEDALGFYQKAHGQDPENTNALNSLGYIMAERNESLFRALQYCRKAVYKKPENPAYLDSLGWTYYKTGNAKQAGQYLKVALSRAPGEALIKQHWQKVLEELS